MASDELKALAAKKGAQLPPGVPADKQKKLENCPRPGISIRNL